MTTTTVRTTARLALGDGRATPAGMRNPGHPFDVEVGRRLQAARYAAGLSQEELAACVGRTFQQVQKYERGDNRMALSTAARFCAVLEIELAEFIAGVDPTGA